MRIVWIVSEKCWGDVISMNVEYSLVRYSKDGFDIDEMIENHDLIDIKDLGVDYEFHEYLP
jgi:hypothetical protein